MAQEKEHILYGLFGPEEERSEDDLIRIETLLSKPLRINSDGRDALLSSGLFSAYQAATILDYRERMGDILSEMEFSLVDGIGEYTAKRLSALLSFAPSGTTSSARPTGKSTARIQYKNGDTGWSSRTSGSLGRIDASVAARETYAGNRTYAGYCSYTSGKCKILVGDYSLRFGQGLMLWSGMSMSGVTSPLSLYKRAGVISGTSSYSTTSHRGLAAVLYSRKTIFTPFVSFPGIRTWIEGGKKDISVLSGGNMTVLLPWGQGGCTVCCQGGSYAAVSVDGRACLRGIDLFAEACWEPRSHSIAGVCGATIPVSERGRVGLAARGYPGSFQGRFAGALRTWSKTSDETGLSVSYGRNDMTFAIDWAKRTSKDNRQLKLSFTDIFTLSRRTQLKIRATGRHRNYGSERDRYEIRSDICGSNGKVKCNLRLDWVHCNSNGVLSYLETAFEGREKYVIWLRATAFVADKWSERIYTYERDAPGSFLIPAWYGRGYSLSTYMTRKYRMKGFSSISFYLRASFTGYWSYKNADRKPSVPEFRLSASYNF